VLVALPTETMAENVWRFSLLAGYREAKEEGVGRALLEEARAARTLLVQDMLHRVTCGMIAVLSGLLDSGVNRGESSYKIAHLRFCGCVVKLPQ